MLLPPLQIHFVSFAFRSSIIFKLAVAGAYDPGEIILRTDFLIHEIAMVSFFGTPSPLLLPSLFLFCGV